VKPGDSAPTLREALEDIIEGKTVKRSRHSLIWGSGDCVELFTTLLSERGYRRMLVSEVPVEPGERAPAFLLDATDAVFGWVFWEKFSETRMRKLFGSVIRNSKGDWAVQISEKKRTPVFVNPNRISEMDIDHPTGF